MSLKHLNSKTLLIAIISIINLMGVITFSITVNAESTNSCNVNDKTYANWYKNQIITSANTIVKLANQNGGIYKSGGVKNVSLMSGNKEVMNSMLNGAPINVKCDDFVMLVMYKSFNNTSYLSHREIQHRDQYQEIPRTQTSPGDIFAYTEPNGDGHMGIITETNDGIVTGIVHATINNHKPGYIVYSKGINNWAIKKINSNIGRFYRLKKTEVINSTNYQKKFCSTNSSQNKDNQKNQSDNKAIDASVTTENVNSSAQVFSSNCNELLGLTSWDCGVEIKENDQDSLTTGILQIIVNVLNDLTIIAAYLVLGYVIYGGYLYIFSGGDPGKVASGKKTLAHAFIGLAIVMSANLIMSTVRFVLLNESGKFDNCATQECVDAGALVSGTIQWFIAIAGIVSAVFVVYGGISYMTSSGDPGKLKKAKDTIMYALIGLAIVALAEVITAFVTSRINEANEAANVNQINISKEVKKNEVI